jgi:chemotaxis regulatin CheY-phosphate phosphatase CheZ
MQAKHSIITNGSSSGFVINPQHGQHPTRKINQCNPKCQNIDELRTAILQEWQQFPQERLRRLVRSMTRRVAELHNKRGGYTRC